MRDKQTVTLLMTVASLILLVAATLTTHWPPTLAAPFNAVQVSRGAYTSANADNPNPPSQTVKLIFIHHSTGGNWLADPAANELGGDLGRALMNNNYFVSATNYGWGPDSIGDLTDIGHWWYWFRGPDSARILPALYAEDDQNFGEFGSWPRLSTEPPGENQIIMFKSCFPNSQLGGGPNDPPTTGDNPLRGLDAWSEYHTVANAKGIYNDILTYFATRQDKLFVVITAPPLVQNETDAAHAANARAFNNWLVNDWLDSYPHKNVAVFDFYNVLTSNAGNSNTNDLGWETGNHHRWRNSAVQHIQTVNNNFAAYGFDPGDSHPTAAGNRKATGEFVQLLNVFYHRWKGDTGPATPSATPSRSPTGAPPTATRTPTRTQTPSAATRTPTATRTPVRTLSRRFCVPVILKNWVGPRPTATATSRPTVTPTGAPVSGLIQPSDLVYLGAFRLPDGPPEIGWEWSGSAMAYYPDGDPRGPADGFPGSIFGTGHDWNQYVSEISIPIPVYSQAKNLAQLNTASALQDFRDIRGNLFPPLEILRGGLEYLPPQGSQSTAKLYFAWAQHMGEGDTNPSHGWCELRLSNPGTAGLWRIGEYWNYVTGDYLFAIPQDWANAYVGGKCLATGRFRDGGQGGQGPSIFAIAPWQHGNPPAPGTTLAAIPLLLYGNVYSEGSPRVNGYHHSDEWSGAAWLTAGSKSAVIFAGTKGTGNCWYGCLDGTVWPDQPPYPPECPERGWWSTGFVGQIIFYNPADLATVAQGRMQPWQPQPYATLNIDQYLYHIVSGQQKSHVNAASFDRQRGLLYMFEPLADEDKSLIHVWRVQG